MDNKTYNINNLYIIKPYEVKKVDGTISIPRIKLLKKAPFIGSIMRLNQNITLKETGKLVLAHRQSSNAFIDVLIQKIKLSERERATIYSLDYLYDEGLKVHQKKSRFVSEETIVPLKQFLEEIDNISLKNKDEYTLEDLKEIKQLLETMEQPTSQEIDVNVSKNIEPRKTKVIKGTEYVSRSRYAGTKEDRI